MKLSEEMRNRISGHSPEFGAKTKAEIGKWATKATELEAENEKLKAEMAGMLLMEAEGQSFAETIVRENERLREGIVGWVAEQVSVDKNWKIVVADNCEQLLKLVGY